MTAGLLCAFRLIYLFDIYQMEHPVTTAKIFWSGRSQAVRLPKDFRFNSAEVRIRRQGNAVILEPITDDWVWLDRLIGPLDEDFEKAAAEQPVEQDRPELDHFK
jgi:antitoxin VapB